MFQHNYSVPIKPELKHFVLNSPFRTNKKVKSLLKDEYNVNATNNFIDRYIPRLNNYDKKEAKKLQYKTYSMPGGFIGDLFFPLSGSRNSAESAAIPVGRKIAFLLLIEINTRYAYAYQLGNVNVKEIINVDDNTYEREVVAETTKLKTTKSLIEAMKKFLKDVDFITSLRFDGETGIKADLFQKFLKEHNIKFIPTLKQQHSSLSLIDRLTRTIRDMAFNMDVEIVDQSIMNIILKYYNIAPHSTLTKLFYKVDPSLKQKYPDGIAPIDVTRELEELYIKECYKYNLMLNSQNDSLIDLSKPTLCQVYETKNKLDKSRSQLSRDIYLIVGREGNMFKLVSITDDKNITAFKRGDEHRGIRYEPRFKIVIVN